MYRVAFAIDDSADRQVLDDSLRRLEVEGARIVSAFTDAFAVEVYLDIGPAASPRAVAEQIASRLGAREYEMRRVDAVSTGSADHGPVLHRGRVRPAAITQVDVQPDDCTLSIQARHRPYETVETVELEETDEQVAITVLVSARDDDAGQFVSLAVAFTRCETRLDRPLGGRAIVRRDPDHNDLRLRSPGYAARVDALCPAWMRAHVVIDAEPIDTAPPSTNGHARSAHELSPEEVLARLERLVERSASTRSTK